MEIYILDSLLRPIDVVDVFESMLWTERWREMGDFELRTIANPSNRKRFVESTLLSITESRRVMRVETIEDTVDDEGRKILKIKGREITLILEGRTALNIIAGDIQPSWVISDTPGNIMRQMFSSICVDGDLSADDIIPLLVPNVTLYPDDTIDEPSDIIDWEQKPNSLYDALKDLAEIFDLGFRLYRDSNVTRLLFNVYAGSDRTTQQTELSPVVFSPDLENFLNTTEVSTILKTYNVAMVIWVETITGPPEEVVVHQEIVYADPDAPAAEGFERRVLLVQVSTVPDEVLDVPAYLQRLGMDELMKYRPIRALDGEVSQHTQYVYERDYYLGDLVESRNVDGATSNMRVMEQVFVQDEQGQRSYPTLLSQQFITQGTWKSWKYDKAWQEMGAAEYWSNQE